MKRVAPGQEKKFLEILISSDDSKNDNHELKLFLDAYKSADSDKQRIRILSATDPKTYTKEHAFSKGEIPLQWRSVREIYIPKSKTPSENSISHFQPMALLNVEGKLFSA